MNEIKELDLTKLDDLSKEYNLSHNDLYSIYCKVDKLVTRIEIPEPLNHKSIYKDSIRMTIRPDGSEFIDKCDMPA